jgi:cytochrome P450/NADPH-cytochrome P450 reductase
MPALPQHNTPLLVLYGSNMGTAEGIAGQIAGEGEANGFAVTLAPLDDYVDRLPTEGAVIIVTASYNGTPPDNAIRFCNWLNSGSLTASALQGVNYAVFGCGNRDWAATYQVVPRLVDNKLAEFGAKRLCERGEGNAGEDFDGDFERWYEPFWPNLVQALGLDVHLPEQVEKENLYEVMVIEERHPNPFVASFGAKPMVIVENRELQSPAAGRSTRHIELALPEGVTYQTGEHLGVIAQNQPELVRRVAAQFGFDDKTRICIYKHGSGKSNFPLDQPISVYRLLTDYVELQDVITRKQLKTMLNFTECPVTRQQLGDLTGDDEVCLERYKLEVLAKRKSLIDLLEDFPACELPFNVYLEMLPPLRPRYYSISSSPLKFGRICSITVGLVSGPARSGRGDYKGVCSHFLAGQPKGSTIYAFVQDTQSNFKLPRNPRTPLIMIGPGTGLAPFRGFLQERAALKTQGQPVGRSLLFFGCRRPDHDFIYEAEMREFVEQGITELYPAFSRVEGQPKMYVQQQLLDQQAAVWELLQAGAVIYVCGDASRMAPEVRQTFARIYQTQTGKSGDEAEAWLDELATNQRYLVDVWAST